MSQLKGLAHIGIMVKDVERSKDFYKRLGFVLTDEVDVGAKLAFLNAGSCLIELIQPQNYGDARNPGQVDHIAITVNDIIKAVSDAKSNGIAIDEKNIAEINILGGVKNVFFEGPDGERLEFFEYINR